MRTWLAAGALLGLATTSTALAGSFRANDIVAEQNGHGFFCAGGELVLFEAGAFAVIPVGHTNSYIDSRTGSALVGGQAAERIDALRDDPSICAGPVDCADGQGISEAIDECW